MASDPVMLLDSVERPLARLRMVIEQAERELRSLKKAYVAATHQYGESRRTDAASSGLGTLSRQELRIAFLLGQGRDNREIAAELHISVHTVKSHVRNVLRKRGLHSRWQVVDGAPP
jgi:DNA-binding NarL/FixJ family response regulator